MRHKKETPSYRLRNGLAALLVFSLALWVRVEYLKSTVVDTPIRADAFHYVVYAQNLLTHGVFSKQISDNNPVPDAYWSPGFPFFLALTLKFAGDDAYIFILYGQALLGAFVCYVTVLLGMLFLPLWASLTAGLFATFSPHLVSMGGYVLTETLFSFILLVSLYLFCLAVKSSRLGWFPLSGSVFGLTYLVNPVVLFAPLMLGLIWLWIEHRNRLSPNSFSCRSFAVFIIPFVSIVAMWGIRCQLNVPEGSMSSSDRALTNFVIGSHDNFFKVYRHDPRDPANPATLDQARINGSWTLFLEILSKRIIEDPRHYLSWYLIEKPILLWSWDILVGQGDIYVYPVVYSVYQTSKFAIFSYSLMKSLHGWLLLFALLALIYVFRDIGKGDSISIVIFVYAMVFCVSVIYVVLQAEPRYSIPLRPELYLCAAFFFSESWNSWLRLSRRCET